MNWAFYMRSVPFTGPIIAGLESLGGSESACVGLARALVARGHDVTIFAHDLAQDAIGVDPGGVTWEPADLLKTVYFHWNWDAFVSVRMSDPWLQPPLARWRVQWNQDLLQSGGLARGQAEQAFGLCWPVDTIAYVSAYHRKQWEGVQKDFGPLGWVTKNGYDPALVPTNVPRDWRRVLHISRPERGLGPLLEMWPAIRAQVPEAELRICRYSSMYDKDGWGEICKQYDQQAEAIHQAVGGIVFLGELGKAALYRELSQAAVMAYPGLSTFAETSCIAAIEAQACGLPFVGSKRGALAETVPTGVLLDGIAEDPADPYRPQFVEAVVAHLHGCRDQAGWYQTRQAAGRAHVDPAYTYATLAAEWEARAYQEFDGRWQRAPLGIVRQLLHEDDHMTALAALDRLDSEARPWTPAETDEILAARVRCQRVIAGQEHTAESYTTFANQHTLVEAQEPRFGIVASKILGEDRTAVLDVASGNGAGAIRFALEHPTRTVVGIDYAPGLVAQATAAAREAGVSDRVRFEVVPVYNYATHTVTPELTAWVAAHAGQFDALFCGEFLEHCANARGLIDALEPAVRPGGLAVYTMPHGPFAELLERGTPCLRGHVHHWEIDDLQRVFGPKTGTAFHSLDMGLSLRSAPIGHWIVSYRVEPDQPAGERDYGWRAFACRPMQRLSVGILANQDAHDLRRCLDAIYYIADEIVIGDSTNDGSDWVRRVAKEFGARVLIIHAPTDAVHQPDGFAGARNDVLAVCRGEWFLWIDSDETLENAMKLPPYLVTGPFRGYAIKQNHLMLDAPPNFDTPVRCFQRRPEIRFYGCVHEQPQWGDCNGDIMPGLELHDVAIAHIGYRTEGLRRKKAQRNLPLLKRNHERFPDRTLNHVLDLRECVLRASDALKDKQEGLAEILLSKAIRLYEAHCNDPANKYYGIGRPWYEMALANLTTSWQFEVAAAGTQGTLNGKRAKADRLRFRRVDDLRAWWAHKGKELEAGMVGTDPIDTTPVVTEGARELASERSRH